MSLNAIADNVTVYRRDQTPEADIGEWLPILGPTAWLIWDRFRRLPDGQTVHLDDLAVALGVGRTPARNALRRLIDLGVAELTGDTVTVPLAAPRPRHRRPIATYLKQ